MAGDWIKMRTNLRWDSRVIRITDGLGIHPLQTIGALWQVWAWFDEHTTDGNAPGVTKTTLDRITDMPGLADAMEQAGWLTVKASGICLPHFNEHNGQTAKARALTTKRVAAHRKRSCNGGDVTPPLPEKRREEKMREEENKAIARFQPPSIEEVLLHAAMIGLPDSQAQQFWDFYESKGWKVGKDRMKKWHNAISGWKVRWEERRVLNPPPKVHRDGPNI